MTERAQALEAANYFLDAIDEIATIGAAPKGHVGMAVQPPPFHMTPSTAKNIKWNTREIRSRLALLAVQPPPPAGSPTTEQMNQWLSAMETGATHDQRRLAWNNLRDHFNPLKSTPVEPAGTPTLQDALSALRYIRETHGALYGVGWDRLLPVEPAGATPASEDEDDDDVPRERPEGAPDAWTAPLRKPVAPKILSTDDFYALLRILEVLPADPFLSAMQAKLSDEERRQHGNQASHLSGSEFVREIERIEALIQSRVRVKPAGSSETPSDLKRWELARDRAMDERDRHLSALNRVFTILRNLDLPDDVRVVMATDCAAEAMHEALQSPAPVSPVEPTPEPPQDGGNPK